MAAKPQIPTATYRLQFSRNFTFKDAIQVIPYLEKLGISDVYSSPFYRSRDVTDHGYDVINHNELNPVLGTQEDFKAFTDALKERGMGHIADFVPNHMGIADPDNEWWMDVLENGPGSVYAPSLISIGTRLSHSYRTRFCCRFWEISTVRCSKVVSSSSSFATGLFL